MNPNRLSFESVATRGTATQNVCGIDEILSVILSNRNGVNVTNTDETISFEALLHDFLNAPYSLLEIMDSIQTPAVL